ncbi:MAG: helix-turn-helix transcriptional regulator [Acidimicrobiales bacterium]|nr:helix-turn-helix transcriptional regulator [Acidimicrobiales bacterium]
MTKTYTRHTSHAAQVLGHQVAAGRRRRRWTIDALANRANVSAPTVRKVEKGDPSVALGTAFDLAVLVGVPLFAEDAAGLAGLAGRLEDRIAVLPRRVDVDDSGLDDDF